MNQKHEPFRVRIDGLSTRLHEDLYHRILTVSWPVFFLLAGLLFILENLFFATLYYLQPGSIAGAREGAFADAFFFSVQTMGTIGYGVLSPKTPYAQAMVTFEALAGMLTLAILTGITFAKFARPSSRVMFTSRAVICKRDGDSVLLFRMANARHNTIAEASLKVILLADAKTKEGEEMRVPIPIPLVRSENPFFRLSWTAVHRIDESSPFYGTDALEKLAARHPLILLALSGLDETLGQTIHARYTYEISDIVVGARFSDIISIEPDGTRVIDYAHFHGTVPEEPSH